MERPSDLRMAACLVLELTAITATLVAFFWLFGNGASGPVWAGIVAG